MDVEAGPVQPAKQGRYFAAEQYGEDAAHHGKAQAVHTQREQVRLGQGDQAIRPVNCYRKTAIHSQSDLDIQRLVGVFKEWQFYLRFDPAACGDILLKDNGDFAQPALHAKDIAYQIAAEIPTGVAERKGLAQRAADAARANAKARSGDGSLKNVWDA